MFVGSRFVMWCCCCWLVKSWGSFDAISLLLLGSAMVATYITLLWCIEELFVVRLSDVLIMML